MVAVLDPAKPGMRPVVQQVAELLETQPIDEVFLVDRDAAQRDVEAREALAA